MWAYKVLVDIILVEEHSLYGATHIHTHTHTHTRTSVDPTSSHRIQLSDDIPNLSSVDAAANEDVETLNEGLIKLFNLQGNI